MSSISIIGAGNMAATIATLALRSGHTVEVIARDPAKSTALAAQLGEGASAGTFSDAPNGDIVILAVLADGAVPAVRRFGDALTGKILIDITNPFNADGTGLSLPHDTSIAQQVAEAAPEGTQVIKAFNTLFRPVLARGGAVVLMAGGDAEAKASVSAFIESIGLRPRDTGDLSMAHWVEGAGVLTMGLARYGVGHFDFSIGIDELS